jgi:hypothetical protein
MTNRERAMGSLALQDWIAVLPTTTFLVRKLSYNRELKRESPNGNTLPVITELRREGMSIIRGYLDPRMIDIFLESILTQPHFEAQREGGSARIRFLAVSSGFGHQVSVVPAWRVDEGVIVSLAA